MAAANGKKRRPERQRSCFCTVNERVSRPVPREARRNAVNTTKPIHFAFIAKWMGMLQMVRTESTGHDQVTAATHR
jgi:hypothetical protein